MIGYLPMPPFHQPRTQVASTSKRRRGQSLLDPASEVEHRRHQVVRLSAAVGSRRQNTAQTVPALEVDELSRESHDVERCQGSTCWDCRFRWPETYQKGDAACRSAEFETRKAAKGARFETLSVLVWMGGFYCGQEVT